VLAKPYLGGHGDDILELSSCSMIPDIAPGVAVMIEFFGEFVQDLVNPRKSATQTR
jgi:hypothetical protein